MPSQSPAEGCMGELYKGKKKDIKKNMKRAQKTNVRSDSKSLSSLIVNCKKQLTHALLVQNVVWRLHIEKSCCSFIRLHAVLCA